MDHIVCIFSVVVDCLMVLTDSIILLYFIRLNNSYCAVNLNVALDHVITVLFVLFVFV